MSRKVKKMLHILVFIEMQVVGYNLDTQKSLKKFFKKIIIVKESKVAPKSRK